MRSNASVIALLALGAGCNKERAPAPVAEAGPVVAPAPPPRPRALALSECPPVAAAAPAVPQVTIGVAKVLTNENRITSYRMDHVATRAARWAGSAYDGAAVWSGETRLKTIPCPGGCTVHAAAFADDDRTLLVGLARFDLETGAATRLEEVDRALHTAGMTEVTTLAWPADGKQVLVSAHHRPSKCCDKGPARAAPPPDQLLLLDGRTGAPVKRLGRSMHAIAISATQIVAETSEGLTVWDRVELEPTVRRTPAGVGRIVFDPSGTRLATAVQGKVTVWRMPDFCPVTTFDADPKYARAIAFHPTAPVVFVVGTDRKVHAWSTELGGRHLDHAPIPRTASSSDDAVSSIAVTDDGKTLIAPLYMKDDILLFPIDLH